MTAEQGEKSAATYTGLAGLLLVATAAATTQQPSKHGPDKRLWTTSNMGSRKKEKSRQGSVRPRARKIASLDGVLFAALYRDSEWRRGPLQDVRIANRCATIFPHKDGYMPQFMPLTPDKPWLVSMRTLYTNNPPIRVQHARLPSERSPDDQPPYRPAFCAQSKHLRNSLKPWVKP